MDGYIDEAHSLLSRVKSLVASINENTDHLYKELELKKDRVEDLKGLDLDKV